MREDAGTDDCEDHSCVAWMSDIFVKAAGDEIGFAYEFSVAYEFLLAEVLAGIEEQDEIGGD